MNIFQFNGSKNKHSGQTTNKVTLIKQQFWLFHDNETNNFTGIPQYIISRNSALILLFLISYLSDKTLKNRWKTKWYVLNMKWTPCQDCKIDGSLQRAIRKFRKCCRCSVRSGLHNLPLFILILNHCYNTSD